MVPANGRSLCDARHGRAPPVRFPAMAKVRLDTLLHRRGLFESRARAAASVMAGEVRLGTDGARAAKPGQLVAEDVALAVDERPRYVSRGGVKLENALAATRVDPAGRRCLDVGASTGGVTHCLLPRGGGPVVGGGVAPRGAAARGGPGGTGHPVP